MLLDAHMLMGPISNWKIERYAGIFHFIWCMRCFMVILYILSIFLFWVYVGLASLLSFVNSICLYAIITKTSLHSCDNSINKTGIQSSCALAHGREWRANYLWDFSSANRPRIKFWLLYKHFNYICVDVLDRPNYIVKTEWNFARLCKRSIACFVLLFYMIGMVWWNKSRWNVLST